MGGRHETKPRIPPALQVPRSTLLMTRHPEQRRLRRVSYTPLEPRTRDPSPSARLRMTNVIITSPAAPAPLPARDDSSGRSFVCAAQDDGKPVQGFPNREPSTRIYTPRMPKLDPTTDEFRAAGHRLIDWIGDYFDRIDGHDVLSRVQPGDVERQFAAEPSSEGKPYDALLREFEQKIIPGITHWNHPSFFAYFSITGSQAGVLGELLSAAINANGMLWRTSPSVTELETVTLRWLREAL